MLIISFSCSDLDKEKQEKSVSDLKLKVEKIEQEFSDLKIDSISSIKLSTYNVERQVKQKYFSDSIDLVFGRKMDDYKRMRRMLGPIGKEENKIVKSISEEKAQLKKLAIDIANGYGKRESYNEYIQFEKKKVAQIKILFDGYILLRAQFLDLYNKLNPELLSFINTLNED